MISDMLNDVSAFSIDRQCHIKNGTISIENETISQCHIENGTISASLSGSIYNMYDDILRRLTMLESSTPEYTELKCRECGGIIEQKYEDNIVKCPYCKTAYIIGRKLVNA